MVCKPLSSPTVFSIYGTVGFVILSEFLALLFTSTNNEQHVKQINITAIPQMLMDIFSDPALSDQFHLSVRSFEAAGGRKLLKCCLQVQILRYLCSEYPVSVLLKLLLALKFFYCSYINTSVNLLLIEKHFTFSFFTNKMARTVLDITVRIVFPNHFRLVGDAQQLHFLWHSEEFLTDYENCVTLMLMPRHDLLSKMTVSVTRVYLYIKLCCLFESHYQLKSKVDITHLEVSLTQS